MVHPRGLLFYAILNPIRRHITSQRIHLESMLEAIGVIIGWYIGVVG